MSAGLSLANVENGQVIGGKEEETLRDPTIDNCLGYW
jgi:hypothetical protein